MQPGKVIAPCMATEQFPTRKDKIAQAARLASEIISGEPEHVQINTLLSALLIDATTSPDIPNTSSPEREDLDDRSDGAQESVRISVVDKTGSIGYSQTLAAEVIDTTPLDELAVKIWLFASSAVQKADLR